MRHEARSWIAGTILLVSLAIPSTSLAQVQAQGQARKHKHYTLYDVGTLGGPNSEVNSESVVINPGGVVVGGADTTIYDPTCDCYVQHAFKWRKGVLTDLGTLSGGAGSFAIAINSQGAVAGTSENGLIDPVSGLPAFDATIWSHGQITDLGTLGGMFSLPGSINDRGQAAGVATNTIPDPDGLGRLLIFGDSIPTTQWHASLWQNGTIQDLGTLGDGPDSDVAGINDRGQIAGSSYTSSIPDPVTGIPPVHPFFWESGHMTDIGTLGGAFATATALNSSGQVAGTSDMAGDQAEHAFLWHRGSLQDLGTLGGDYTFANWLNDPGEVVGGSTTPNNVLLRAVRWKNGHVTDLGSVAGDDCSNAWSINSRGQIVGESFGCSEDTHHAFLWENGGPMVDLNDLVAPNSGLFLTEAQFIGPGGEIAGLATLDNGDTHAFVLIPKDGDDADNVASQTDAASSEVVPAARNTASGTHPALTPEMKAALQIRFARRHHSPALGLPGRTQ